MKSLSASHDKAYVMRFLMVLNESFDTFCSQVLMSDHFPPISKVYSLVLHEESPKSIGHGGSFSPQPETVAMYANSKRNYRNSNWNKGGNKKERPFCTHYNMPGHTVDKCYKLHGYPPGTNLRASLMLMQMQMQIKFPPFRFLLQKLVKFNLISALLLRLSVSNCLPS